MKVCFIGGCGHWWDAYEYLKTRRDVEFCGFAPASSHEARSESIASDIPFFTDYHAMLDATQPALAIVSPVYGLTGKINIECAERGIDIFSEKPIACSFEELAALRKAVEQHGVRLGAMHYLRTHPAFWRAAQLVREGAIGKVNMITAQKSYKYGTRPAWYGDRTLYGGTILWVGIHAIDWVAGFAGTEFISATARCVGENPEMAALCQFEMENNIIANVNIDFYRPAGAATHGDDRVRCVGTDGVIEVMGGSITLIDRGGTHEIEPTDAPDLLEDFLNGGDVLTTDEVFRIAAAGIAARDSADRGKTVKI